MLEQAVHCAKQSHRVRERWLVCIHGRDVRVARQHAARVGGVVGEAICETCRERIDGNDLGVRKFLRVSCGDCVRDRHEVVASPLGLPMEARA